MTINELPSTPDRPTLIAISAVAYIAAVGLHEHLGHTLACITLGSHPTEVGAFYINCDYAGMSDISIRLVALAGPLVSLLIGIVSFLILYRRAPRAPPPTISHGSWAPSASWLPPAIYYSPASPALAIWEQPATACSTRPRPSGSGGPS